VAEATKNITAILKPALRRFFCTPFIHHCKL
jgi:hypothetical protein